MDNKNIITKKGQIELKEELKNLIEIERPRVIEEIKEARALGDLSENAEFDAAREKQGQIEDRIKDIETVLENAEIISTKKNSSHKARFGSEITYKDLKNKSENTVTLVGSLEADPFTNKISNSSPIGKALLDASEGDVITVQVDNKYDIQILKIDS